MNGNAITARLFSEGERARHSTFRELIAVSHGLKSFENDIRFSTVKVLVDNQSTVRILDIGSMKPELHKIAMDVFYKHVYLAKSKNSYATANLLKRYLDETKLTLDDNHFLFCPIKKVKEKYLTTNNILSYTTYNDITKKMVKSIGLEPSNYGTHSCRAGGATDLAPHVTQHDLLVSGRWSDPRSIRRYVELSEEKRIELSNILQDAITIEKE